ncbi:MAG: glycosyltransferase [Bacteroidota bacterium]|nr:glycosyltransferase [Bacteroidota bacterium]
MSSYEYPFEIILVNDYSTDNTTPTIQSYCSENSISNIRILEHDKNYGQSVATLNGMRAANGKYVIILDDDLQYQPYQIKLLIDKIISSNGINMVCGYKVNEKKTKSPVSILFIQLSMILLRLYFRKFYRSNYFTPFKIFKKTLFLENDHLNIYYFWNFNMNKIISVPVTHSKSIRQKSNYSLFKLFSEYYFLIIKIFQRTIILFMTFFFILSLYDFFVLKTLNFISFYLLEISVIAYLASYIILYLKNKFMINRKYREIL